MQKCSYCGRENNDGALHCSDCGTALKAVGATAEAAPENPVEKNPRRAAGKDLMVDGVVWTLGGLLVTLASYFAAIRTPYGGHYFIAHGAIIYGLAKYFRGRAAARGTDGGDQAHELLQFAAQLE